MLYVDGSARSLSNVQCGAGTGGAFACSGQLPPLVAGAHTLELAAVDRGVEGPRSAPFNVMVSPGATASAVGGLPTPSGARVVCLDAAVDECYDATSLADGLGPVSDLTLAADGRAFFIEDSRAVRILSADGLAADPALMAEGDTERFVGLAVSPDFSRSRFVYVGVVDEGPQGAEFMLRRYREVGGVLGQGAALVTGLPAPGSTRVPVAVDAQGYLYVALPAAPDSLARLSAFAYNGFVLRFAADGSVPADQASPILARGEDQPSALLFDSNGSRLWLASGSAGKGAALLVIPTRHAASPVRVHAAAPPVGASQATNPVDQPMLALRGLGPSVEVWLTGGLVYRGVVNGEQVQQLQVIDLGIGHVRAMTPLGENQLLFAVEQPGRSAEASTEILRLLPRSGVVPQ